MTTVLRIAAFSDGNRGGNPAGVWIGDVLPDATKMQAIAAEVGFSETAFAAPDGDAWRVRYFSPLTEVPFCGHATIALGAALAHRYGDRTFELNLNDAVISVTGRRDGKTVAAALQSPPTRSAPIDPSGRVSGPVRLRDRRSRPKNPARQDSRRCRSCRPCSEIARSARPHEL